MSIKNSICIVVAMLVSAACSGGGDDASSGDNGLKTEGVFATDCGIYSGGDLLNPVDSADGQLVDIVSVADVGVMVVRGSAGDFLVKLPGVSSEGSRRESALQKLQQLASSGKAVYFPAEEGCTVSVSGGATAFVGQLFTLSGLSYVEELIKSGYITSSGGGSSCGQAETAVCYNALVDSHAKKSAGQITDFLWKPRAESPYNKGMPVIHVNPCNATVYVNGDKLLDYGEGNGRCNTSRMLKSCSSFGSNVRVEIIDNETGAPYYHGDKPYVIVPNGCSRYEFKA